MNEKDEQELLSRIRRVETRLMRLAEMLGLDPSDKVRAKYDKTKGTIELTGTDVSVSNLLDIVRREGISGNARLEVNGKLVGWFMGAST